MLAQMLPRVQERFHGRLQVVKIDSEKNPALASKFGVQGLPTMILFDAGGRHMLHRIEGMPPEPQLVAALEAKLPRGGGGGGA